MLELSTQDLELIKSKGISKEQIENQVNNFRNGFPFANIISAATPSNGIVIMTNEMLNNSIEYYNTISSDTNILKFVPASGAASRMFKHLFEFRAELKNNSFKDLIVNPKYKLASEFFNNLEYFAFYNDLTNCYRNKKTDNAKYLLDCLLEPDGLNYASLPKALLKFHSYSDKDRIALEEHLVEAVQYAKSQGDIARIHFTVSNSHQEYFSEQLKTLIPYYEKEYNIKFEIELSNQKPSTDTIAVDSNNNIFRDDKGQMFFRPGGHGALIENLNELDADLIFIKNIDNVVRDEKRQATIDYKKALGGYGLLLQQDIFELLKELDLGNGIEKAIDFITNKLGQNIREAIKEFDTSEKLDYLYTKLNRPLRVCGMVKNIGEPGGGPFWVDKNGEISLQIVESAEIDLKDPSKREIMLQSTHFNPVDLVCFTKDFMGNKFNLKEFVDNDSAFISEKSKDGKVLKAMELPGLWNGAMAFWNTIFIEVPLETFNPVKTVNDLLREMHRRD